MELASLFEEGGEGERRAEDGENIVGLPILGKTSGSRSNDEVIGVKRTSDGLSPHSLA